MNSFKTSWLTMFQMSFMFALVVFSFVLGSYAKSCEIQAIQDYIDRGGQLEISNNEIVIIPTQKIPEFNITNVSGVME